MEETMKKDPAALGFGYHPTPYRYVAHYADGAWDAGGLTTDSEVRLSESACVLQYAQTVFEGLKAYRTVDGRLVCFRPDLNAARLSDSCRRMCIPPLPDGQFLDAVRAVVAADRDCVPPYGSGASLYLRPFVFGTTPVVGVKPAKEFEFRLFATPVGPYFAGGVRPLSLRVADYDRAAPHGTGHIKAGLNYAMSLYPLTEAHEEGYDENIYLDAATRRTVEETGGANLLFVTCAGTLVTPRSPSILPSITRRSLLYVAEHILGIPVEERPVAISELDDFAECGLCGTAAVISPVGAVTYAGRRITFPYRDGEMGPVTRRLLDTLRGIQLGTVPAPAGWLLEVG